MKNKTRGRKILPGAGLPTTRAGIERLMEQFENQVATQEFKISVGDYIRLAQIKREMDVDEPKVIEVKWTDPPDPESSGE